MRRAVRKVSKKCHVLFEWILRVGMKYHKHFQLYYPFYPLLLYLQLSLTLSFPLSHTLYIILSFSPYQFLALPLLLLLLSYYPPFSLIKLLNFSELHFGSVFLVRNISNQSTTEWKSLRGATALSVDSSVKHSETVETNTVGNDL